MNSIINKLVSTATATLLTVGMSAIMFGGTAHAIPWTSTSTGLTHPGFNVFTGVPGYGDESDFVRGHVAGSTTDFTDPVNDACADGTQYSVRVYVHNGANQTLNNNGTGPGVAHNTKVKVNVPSYTSSKITGTISASNAATVNDTLSINCSGEARQLTYVAGSAIEQHMDGSIDPLSDNIVSSGAPIGTHSANGDVWGCFDQRVLVFLKVKVTKKPVVIQSLGECKVVDVKTYEDRKVSVKVHGDVTNAKIIGYKIDFGDGTVSHKQSDSHQYAKDGTYTIVTSVQIKFADGHVEWKTAVACQKQVTFKTNVPPKVIPPTPTPTPSPKVLVNTGAGDIAGIFTGTSVLGAFLHRKWTLRKQK